MQALPYTIADKFRNAIVVADDLPLFSRRSSVDEHTEHLTPGGAVIWRRVRRPTSTCNLLAQLAGIGQVEA